MTKKLFFTLSFFISLCVSFAAPLVHAAISPSALITEVQTGTIDAVSGLEYPKQEFIEVANVSSGPLKMDGWRLEYLSAAHNGTGEPTAVLLEISGTLPLNGQALFSYIGYNPTSTDASFGEGSTASSGMLAKSGGHVRLVNGEEVIDCVAWGSAVAIAGCDKVSSVASAGQTIQRPHSDNGSYDKALGVKNLSPPTPLGGQLYPSFDPPTPNPNGPNVPGEEEPEEPEEPSIPLTCSSIELSEVLPNPAGTDAAGEFIELYNPTDQAISLQGCSLRFGMTGKTYTFSADAVLVAHEYRAFMYSTTAISLTNSGGEVWFLSPGVQSSLTYPASEDDQAWAFIDGVWQTTFRPTPNAANVRFIPGEDVGVQGALTAAAEPCPVGKYRNPETNRCKNIETENGPTPCAEGQERNPETNRCRKITTTTTTVTPCGPGQERNPETNRCRKVQVAATAAPCPEGQERNQETNRCRKVAATTPKNSQSTEQGGGSRQNYVILAIVFALIAGYAIYEYRQDIRVSLGKLRMLVLRRKEP